LTGDWREIQGRIDWRIEKDRREISLERKGDRSEIRRKIERIRWDL
jgi:hypothetical protein